MSVLIVEDEEPVAIFFRFALERHGIACRRAGTAEGARGAIAEKRPQLILVDLNLPGESGLSFVKRLKADPTLADIPVVALTADDVQWSRETVLAAGCVEFLIKPVALSRLEEVVRRYLPK